jgi:hypothetical protein
MGNIALWFIDRRGKGEHKRLWTRDRIDALAADDILRIERFDEAEPVYETADGRRFLVVCELTPHIDLKDLLPPSGMLASLCDLSAMFPLRIEIPTTLEAKIALPGLIRFMEEFFALVVTVGEKALSLEAWYDRVRIPDFGNATLFWDAHVDWQFSRSLQPMEDRLGFEEFLEKRYPGEFEILEAPPKQAASDKREEEKPDFRGKCLNALLRHYVPEALKEGEDEDEIVCRWLVDLLRPRDFDSTGKVQKFPKANLTLGRQTHEHSSPILTDISPRIYLTNGAWAVRPHRKSRGSFVAIVFGKAQGSHETPIITGYFPLFGVCCL